MVIANWWARVRCRFGYHCRPARGGVVCAETRMGVTVATIRCACGAHRLVYEGVWRRGRWVGWRVLDTRACFEVTATPQDTVWFDDLPAITAKRSA
jgi:hypothetical protein